MIKKNKLQWTIKEISWGKFICLSLFIFTISRTNNKQFICKGKLQQLQSRKQNNRLTCCGHVLPMLLLVCSVNSQFSHCSHYATLQTRSVSSSVPCQLEKVVSCAASLTQVYHYQHLWVRLIPLVSIDFWLLGISECLQFSLIQPISSNGCGKWQRAFSIHAILGLQPTFPQVNLLRPFRLVCIKRDVCGLGTARHPMMHFNWELSQTQKLDNEKIWPNLCRSLCATGL